MDTSEKSSSPKFTTIEWSVLVSILTAAIGISVWLQSGMSDRPTRAETQQMIDRSLDAVKTELTHTNKTLEKIDGKIDRLSTQPAGQ